MAHSRGLTLAHSKVDKLTREQKIERSKVDKLAKLTREQKIELLQALEEKKRRQRERRDSFMPHAGQLPIALSTKNKRIVVAANGFGKSAYAVNEAMWALDGYNPVTKQYSPVPARVIVVLDSPEKIADVWLPEIRKWREIKDDEQLHKRGKPYYSEISWPNGSILRFMFHLMEPLAFESISGVDLCVFDEPPPKSVWVALLRAGRQKGRQSKYLLIGTPIAQPWLREYYNEWQKGNFPDSEFIRGSTEANRDNLAEGYIESFSMHLTEREKATRLHGEFFNTEGMALAGLFKRDVHVAADLPPEHLDWPAVISFDPHPNKPTHACLVLAAPDGKLYYVKERAEKAVPREWARWIKGNWLSIYNVVDMITDNYGSGEFTGGEGFKSFVEVFREEGLRIRPTTYDEKKDDEFLERLQTSLAADKLTIHSSCIGLISDVENVQWKQLKGTEEYLPKLEIGNKDFLACLKYALAANLTYDNAKRAIVRPPGMKEKRARAWRVGLGERPMGSFEKRWIEEKRRRTDADDDW